ncbi:MAG TPA: efflux RND transporter periplasmic adaptor subunit [Vicinamibacterales bacterium]|nr:efflux RND transporter periplasmic adaptor subunit [Vicinamibacterales bacterium]
MKRLLTVALAGLTVMTIGACGRKAPELENVEPIAVTVQPVQLATVRDAVTFNGTVTPISVADFVVFAPVACTIAEINKAEGDPVAVGDVLVKLNVPSISGEIATRQLELTDATAKLDRAKAEADRLADLLSKGLASRVQAETARSSQLAAEAVVSQARAHMDAAQAMEASTIIRARFAGVVAKRWHTAGDLVQGGDTDPIIRVIDPARLQVSAQIPLTDGGRVLVGQAATVQTVNGPEPATVALKVSPASPTVQTYDVRLNFVTPTTLPLDTPVQVDIVVDERKDVPAIPATALQGGGGTTFVWVATPENLATRREVRIGLTAGTLVQIISGLAVGEQVITTGIAELSEGTPITITGK